MNRSRPLAALLIAASAVAALAVPAGASPAPATWTHQTLPCATGHKTATVVTRWKQGPMVEDNDQYVDKGWYDNPCPGQWLFLLGCQPDSQSDCYGLDVGPKHKGRFDAGVYARLQPGPTCDFDSGTTLVSYIPAKNAPSCPDS